MANMSKKNTVEVGMRILKKNYSAWLLLLPSMFFLFIVMWQPIINGIFLSFFKMTGYEVTEFAGFQNYIDVMGDSEFLKTMWNTVQYVIWSLIIGFIPPIAVAVMLNEIKRFKGFFKFSMYFPNMVPTVATALIWYFLFQPGEGGVLNMLLGKISIPQQAWLQNSALTIPLIVFTMTWKGFGATTILYLASLQGVNSELYEAATIDGAGVWSRLKNITIPQISGVALLMLVRQIISVFQVMVEPMTMTDGGPNNASMTLCLQGYNYAFRYFQVDKSLALGVITFVILIILTFFYFKLKNKVEEN